MIHPIPTRRILQWLLPSALSVVLLLLLPEPWWPLAFVPALTGMLLKTRKDDLRRPLSPGYVLVQMSPILVLSALTLLFYAVPSLRDHLPADWIVRLTLFLGWMLSAYNLWRRSLRARPGTA